MTNEDVYVDGINKVAHATGYDPEVVHGMLEAGAEEMTKEASPENLYVDGLTKIAKSTGLDPEVLDEGIAMFFKQAAEDGDKPRAESDADEARTQQVNEELNEIAKYIEELEEDEVKELLEEFEGGE